MKKIILFAIALAAIAPLFAIGGARTGAAIDQKCDTMSISADSLLKEQSKPSNSYCSFFKR